MKDSWYHFDVSKNFNIDFYINGVKKERRTTMLFEVAVLVTPTVSEKEEGKLEEIVLHPQFIIAADAQSASMQVIMDNTEALTKVDKSRLQVLVRPF